MIVKAVSLTQPWASLMVAGPKRNETRSWNTLYRGPLAIHASGMFPAWARDVARQEGFYEALAPIRSGGITRMGDVRFVDGLPVGAIVGLVDLKTCVEIFSVDDLYYRGILNKQEQTFGNYTKGRFVWVTTDPRVLDQPYPCRGALGLWTIDIPSRLVLRPAHV